MDKSSLHKRAHGLKSKVKIQLSGSFGSEEHKKTCSVAPLDFWFQCCHSGVGLPARFKIFQCRMVISKALDVLATLNWRYARNRVALSNLV